MGLLLKWKISIIYYYYLAIIRQTRKKFETEDLRNESGSSSLMRNERIWGIGSDISTTSQVSHNKFVYYVETQKYLNSLKAITTIIVEI
jgi:hypothetical protein